ncbi:MAG: hypothetical protein PHY28_01725 [Dehalococcoidales bacterium]|nr:hypothetical protein [Dehalococcoidales bacterium]
MAVEVAGWGVVGADVVAAGVVWVPAGEEQAINDRDNMQTRTTVKINDFLFSILPFSLLYHKS